jgi:hypothetical protein
VCLHSNVGVTLPLAAAGYAAYAIAMAARFSGDWLAQHVSGKNILHGNGLLIAAGLGCILLSHSWWPAVFGLMLAGTGVANIVPVIWSVAGRDTRMGACSSTSVGSFVRARFQTGGVFFAVIHAFGVVGDHPGWKKT